VDGHDSWGLQLASSALPSILYGGLARAHALCCPCALTACVNMGSAVEAVQTALAS
jgi:hypothetical protein